MTAVVAGSIAAVVAVIAYRVIAPLVLDFRRTGLLYGEPVTVDARAFPFDQHGDQDFAAVWLRRETPNLSS